jgi:hypothetical protein
MKHLKILLAVIGLLVLSPFENFSQSTFPYADNLCYTESFVEKIKVSNQINTSTLTLQDKLRFTEKTFLKEHHEYIKNGSNPVHDIKYRYWTKIFPKWYKVADIIRIDESGTRSYFITNNQYLPGGWSGHTYTTTQHGYYSTGERQGEERFYHQDHTTQSLTAYNLHKQSIEIFGYISKFRYFYPSAQILTKFSQQGFTVFQNTNHIQVSNSEVRITWRLTEKTMIREHLVNSTVVKTIITKYKYFETVGQDLKYKETEITPDILENGDCIEIVAETIFDDYNTNCTNEVAFRSSEKSVKMDEVRVIPNPASDIISFIIPTVDGVSKVSIISTTGQLMYSGVSIDSPSQIDVSLYPAGLYLVNVIQGTKSYTSKFVKQ